MTIEPTPAAVGGRIGLLLVNLGTPDAPRAREVRRYLREFLSDPRVLDMPAWRRFLILELLILPFRPRRSAAAYAKIWTPAGSPLLVHGRALAAKLRDRLGPGALVELAMRYGAPSIEGALASLERGGATRIVLLPLFPHQSGAATASAVARVLELARRRGLEVEVVPPFFAHGAYLDARADSIRPQLVGESFDRVFFTFHGLPERQIRRTDASGGHCLGSTSCCAELGERNRSCYRAQCFETVRLLSSRLELGPERTVVCFQSRLGRSPWIGPATDERLAAEARAGARRALVVPSFVADCLETLEELGIRGAEIWKENGGESLTIVPALNADDRWVDAVVEIVRDGSPAFALAFARSGAPA